MPSTVPEKGGTKEQTPRRPAKRSPKEAPKHTPAPPIDDPEKVMEVATHALDISLPRISAVTGVEAPHDIELTWGDKDAMTEAGAAAMAFSSGVIQLNPNDVIGMTADQLTGLIIHEATHEVLRDVTHGDAPESIMLTEGMADYVKDVVQPDVPKDFYNGSDAQLDPNAGYQGAAAFLQYLEHEKPGTVKRVIGLLQAGSVTPLQDITGKPLPELLQEYNAGTHLTQGEYQTQKHEAKKKYNAGVQRAQNDWVQWYMSGYDNQDYTWSRPAAPAPHNYPPLRSAYPGGYPGQLDAPPQPPHLLPHYAAGPNPGITAVMQNPSYYSDPTVAIPGSLFSGQPLGLESSKLGTLLGHTWTSGGTTEDPPQDDPPADHPTQTTSSSSSSSSSSASKYDSYISDIFKSDAVSRQKATMFASAYSQLWGEPATENYIIQAVKEGWNTAEFIHHERMKTAFQQTKTYKDEAKGLYGILRQLGI